MALYDQLATPQYLDFSSTPDRGYSPTRINRDPVVKPLSPTGALLTPKQIRTRVRRRSNRNMKMSEQELTHLYPQKPIEEWDLEELARGKPRNKDGSFKGRKPTWITREIHEQAMDRYKTMVKDQMNSITVKALNFMANAIDDDSVDDKGKPIIPASTKADLSKFLIEHVVGKPVARIEQDVSVKLQSILGTVMVNPRDATADTSPAHFPGVTMAMYEDVEEAEVLEDEDDKQS